MANSLVSIIMGVYNGQDTLESCIDSIISQTYQHWEFIICDDCSSDNTWDILRKFQKKDSRIIILHNEKNMRLAASLNKCLKTASGKYVARMDADDISLPQRLEKQVSFLEEHQEYDVVGSSCIIFDDDAERGVRLYTEFPNKNVLLKGTSFAHPTIVMRKKVYDALGGYSDAVETMRAEDLELWFRFFEKGYQGYNLQEPLYRYRESKNDLEKRTLQAGIKTAKVYWNGYKRLKFPLYKRFWALKPIVAALVPNWLMMKYHDLRLKG